MSIEKTSEFNLAFLIDSSPESSVALRTGESEITYGCLKELVSQARWWLKKFDIKPGDRVALALPNVVQMPILYFATLSLGAVVVPLNPLLSANEVNFHTKDSQTKLLVSWQGARLAQELVDLDTSHLHLAIVDSASTFFEVALSDLSTSWSTFAVAENDPAVLLYTSGTTGKPKGAVLTHKNLLSNARTVADFFEYRADDIFFGGLPLFHAFGQTVSMNAVFAAGASVALLPRFKPDDAATLCAKVGVTVLAAVPSMYSALAAFCETRDVSSLYGKIRFGISGGSALPATVHADFHRLLACPIYEGYGLSETSPVVSFNQERFGLVVGSVGRALPGVEVAVRGENGGDVPVGEPGQLWVRGDNVMAEYWHNPQETAKVFDGDWFATGDVARIDTEGNIFIVDRIKDMILRNGYSVYPREIEDILYTHPQVRLVAVIGVQQEKVGEEIRAVIVPKQSLDLAQQNALIEELDSLCRQKMAAYKYPREFSIVKELPLGPTGKILKRELSGSLQSL
ncbi:AMP-binding protein [uncultured Rothia sp.]|uniref:AMP-binding protein n=1 Tax=uncultured Rothia sp. TaxID=316088 RepID=UPI0032175F24